MDRGIIQEVKRKREFKGLPDSVVRRVLEGVKNDLVDLEKVKEARRILRKYFGVFLTNKVLKPKNILDFDSVLKSHKSSMKRNYSLFYERLKLFVGYDDVFSVIDLGSGLNGFSYPYICKFFGNVSYLGVEALGQVVDNTNSFFQKSGFSKCKSIHGDLFDLDFVCSLLNLEKKKRVVFLFQVIDALENLERDFSKKFLLMLKENSEYIVVSFPIESLSGKKQFEVKRNWIVDFLKENFEFLGDEKMFGEHFICLKC